MAAISIFFYLLLFSFSEATNNHGRLANGFTTTLIHRDSHLSPLHNPSVSRYDSLTNAFRRSFSRSATILRHVTSVSTTGTSSPIIPNNGEFLMSISIGTPPVDFIAIADTGSDLTWTQCLPCERCFNQSRPIFNPRRSSSYRKMSCTSDICRSLDTSYCGRDLQTCRYGYSYGDRSYTYGDLSTDKITIGSFKLSNTVIGCGHQNGGTFGGGTSGIIGLGGGALSLVSQMKTIAGVKRQFSYCLPTLFSDADVTGKISFGDKAIASGQEAVSTPLITKTPDTYYFLTLEAISVANRRFKAANDMLAFKERGNIIIDSGTTLTLLPRDLYEGVVSSLASVIKGKRLDDPSAILELCYASRRVEDLDIPVVTAHFGGGADVKLLPVNIFAMVADNVCCLTLAPTTDLAIYGNLAQINFEVGYDLEQKRLSFKPSVCG